MRTRSIRRACLARLGELRRQGMVIPQPFDIAAFVPTLSEVLDRPVQLVRIDMPPGAPSGMTFFTRAAYIIAIEKNASSTHQNHIGAHEAAHVLLGHRATDLNDAEAVELLFPHLRPGFAHRALGRTEYTQDEERWAEMMATVLLEQASLAPADADTAQDPENQALAARLRNSFEH
jgi:hypothetical protein